jgi:hypothetical protein
MRLDNEQEDGGADVISMDARALRLSPIDVVSLTDVEVRAILLKLAGHPDPAVAGAVVDVTREVLARTRG